MFLDNLSPGEKLPEEVNVVIEIPAQAAPVKYEMDKDSGALVVDRFINVAMYYPCNYGFVPHTLSEDGDPVDVLVISPQPIISGAVIATRPIGMLKMTDEKGPDAKILAVPISKLSTMYDNVKKTEDLPKELLAQIEHFFQHYKLLEKNKWVKLDGWAGPEEAKAEIVSSLERYGHKPYVKDAKKA
ncbi:MAG: inorganic diphosphatase [Gammaproteobacteria bacterium]|nr:inorganic diphosphatase [Gammaproteobacteria bacterium]